MDGTSHIYSLHEDYTKIHQIRHTLYSPKMSPRAQLSGGLSADDPLRVNYEPDVREKEERTSLREVVPSPRRLFRRLRAVPFQSTTGQWATNFQIPTRGSPMKTNVVPKNWPTLPQTLSQPSTSSQQFQVKDSSSSTQLEKTILESTVELPLSKHDVEQPSVIQSTALSGGSGTTKKLESRTSDRVASQPELQKPQAKIEKPENHEVGSSPSKPKPRTRSNNGKTAVLQWMDSINNNPSERVEHRAPLVFESEV